MQTLKRILLIFILLLTLGIFYLFPYFIFWVNSGENSCLRNTAAKVEDIHATPAFKKYRSITTLIFIHYLVEADKREHCKQQALWRYPISLLPDIVKTLKMHTLLNKWMYQVDVFFHGLLLKSELRYEDDFHFYYTLYKDRITPFLAILIDGIRDKKYRQNINTLCKQHDCSEQELRNQIQSDEEASQELVDLKMIEFKKLLSLIKEIVVLSDIPETEKEEAIHLLQQIIQLAASKLIKSNKLYTFIIDEEENPGLFNLPQKELYTREIDWEVEERYRIIE